jgi:hypothetical protein
VRLKWTKHYWQQNITVGIDTYLIHHRVHYALTFIVPSQVLTWLYHWLYVYPIILLKQMLLMCVGHVFGYIRYLTMRCVGHVFGYIRYLTMRCDVSGYMFGCIIKYWLYVCFMVLYDKYMD